MYWDCPRCGAENSLNATRCGACGYQYFPGYESSDSRPVRGDLGDFVKKQREEIREGLTKRLDETDDRASGAPDRPGSDNPTRDRRG